MSQTPVQESLNSKCGTAPVSAHEGRRAVVRCLTHSEGRAKLDDFIGVGGRKSANFLQKSPDSMFTLQVTHPYDVCQSAVNEEVR